MQRRALAIGMVVFAAACGQEAEIGSVPAATQTIIGGAGVSADIFPSTGAILTVLNGVNGLFTLFECSAVLIAPDVILSAGHCTDGFAPQLSLDFYFTFDADVSSFYGPQDADPVPTGSHLIAEVIRHPGWISNVFDTPRSGLGEFDDIAVMFLAARVTDVMPATMCDSIDAGSIVNEMAVDIVGYGQTSGVAPIPGEDVGVKTAAVSMITEVGPFEIRIGDGTPAPQKCHGDSGGPTSHVFDDGRVPQERVIGITSRGYGLDTTCTTGSADTRVDAYWDWIDQTLIDGCTRGVRLACDDGGGLPSPQSSGAAGGLGQPCRADGSCDPSLVCDAGLCQASSDPSLGNEGESCDSAGACLGSLECVGDVCVEPDDATGCSGVNPVPLEQWAFVLLAWVWAWARRRRAAT